MFEINFYSASWCSSCRAYKPNLDQFIEQHPDIQLVYKDVDTGNNMQEAQEYGIKSLPFTVLKKDGEDVSSFPGIKSVAELNEWWEGINK